MHRDKSNQNFTYDITNFVVTCTVQEQDAAIMVCNLMKALFRCSVVVRYVDKVLGMIRKGVDDKTEKSVILWHKCMVFPHL